MDIKGGEAWAVVFEDGPRAAKFETGDKDNGWGRVFQEFTAANFGFNWPT